jgi:uncharacterized membrane protein YhaH (DUF805 family)
MSHRQIARLIGGLLLAVAVILLIVPTSLESGRGCGSVLNSTLWGSGCNGALSGRLTISLIVVALGVAAFITASRLEEKPSEQPSAASRRKPQFDNPYFNAYQEAFRKYATFDGRATVREYWTFYLTNSALLALSLLVLPGLFPLLFLGTLLPALAVGVRRLHDQNRSAWYLLISFVPFGVLVLLFWAAQRGTVGNNDYGPDPQGQEVDDVSDCSKCGQEVPEEAKFCPHCGERFDDPSCPNPNCDAKPSENSRFCAECGWNLKAET